MNNPDKNNELFIRWINNDLTAEELRQIELDPDFHKYRAILSEVDQWKVPALDKGNSYKSLVTRRTTTETKTITWYQTNVFRMAAALLLLAAAITWFTVFNKAVVIYETGIAETEEITLPDGSVVHLGASSQLSYNKETWENNRELTFVGVSHFEVVHMNGTPFTVGFNQGSVEVVGTSFEIKSYDDFASVACYDGRVRFITSDSTVELTRGKGARVRGRELGTFEFQNHTWSQAVTRFYSAPLSAVIKSLEAEFGIKIETNNIELNRTFTGSYTHQSIEVALKMVCDPMNISYELNENTAILQ